MSLTISPMVTQAIPNEQQNTPVDPSKIATAPASETQGPESNVCCPRQPPLVKAVDGLSSYRKINDNKSLKAMAHLSQSLDKALADAKPVDKETAEEEIKQGGLRRIGKDLRKLFKGMGLPPQMAKQLSRGITETIRSEGVEQIDFSLTMTRAAALEMTQTQTAYTETGDGSITAASQTNQFMMTAVQVRSFDFSLNLKTGEYSLSHNRADLLSISASQTETAILLPGEETPETVPAPVEIPEGEEADQAFQDNSTLVEIRSAVQSTSFVDLARTSLSREVDDEAADDSEAMQVLTGQVEKLVPTLEPLYATLTQIRNLRIEEELTERYLRFSVEALAPVGLKAHDDEGYEQTLYPQADGNLAKVEETPLTLTA